MSETHNRILIEMRNHFQLSAPQLAKYMNIGSVETVRNWLSLPPSKRYRPMPASPLELLLIKLQIEHTGESEQHWLRSVLGSSDWRHD